MGYNLDCFSEIVAASLFVDDALVYSAGGNIVCSRGANICKALIVAQVQVGFMPVDGHITFPVLVRVQSTGVDVDIRVKFLNCNTVSAGFQNSCER